MKAHGHRDLAELRLRLLDEAIEARGAVDDNRNLRRVAKRSPRCLPRRSPERRHRDDQPDPAERVVGQDAFGIEQPGVGVDVDEIGDETAALHRRRRGREGESRNDRASGLLADARPALASTASLRALVPDRPT